MSFAEGIGIRWGEKGRFHFPDPASSFVLAMGNLEEVGGGCSPILEVVGGECRQIRFRGGGGWGGG